MVNRTINRQFKT